MSDSTPMAETQSAPSLRELSEAATQGEWHHCQPFMTVPAERTVHGRVPAARVDYISTWPGSGTPPGHRVVVPMEGRESTMSSHDMAFVARLVSDYRAGRLIDPTTQTKAVAAARAEGVREGLERAAAAAEALRRNSNQDHIQHCTEVEWTIRALILTPPTTPGGRTDG